MRRSLRNLILAVVLVVGGFTVGRVFIHHTPTPTTTTTTPPASTTTSPPSTTTVPASTTTTGPASLTTCRGSQFTGLNVGSQGATGTGYDTISLTKVSGPSCVVDGYPVVTLYSAQGALTNFTWSTSTNFPSPPANTAPAAYTVVAGQKVDVQLRYATLAAGTQACPSVQRAAVQFVRGDTPVSVDFTFPITPCGNAIAVSGFYAA